MFCCVFRPAFGCLFVKILVSLSLTSWSLVGDYFSENIGESGFSLEIRQQDDFLYLWNWIKHSFGAWLGYASCPALSVSQPAWHHAGMKTFIDWTPGYQIIQQLVLTILIPFWISTFGCCAHMKAGQNTQQLSSKVVRLLIYRRPM